MATGVVSGLAESFASSIGDVPSLMSAATSSSSASYGDAARPPDLVDQSGLAGLEEALVQLRGLLVAQALRALLEDLDGAGVEEVGLEQFRLRSVGNMSASLTTTAILRSIKDRAIPDDTPTVPLLPTKAGPVPDRLTIWPIDDGRYGLDATFQGETGYERALGHRAQLESEGVPHTFRQELGGGWTLRFGPLSAGDVAAALAAFVY